MGALLPIPLRQQLRVGGSQIIEARQNLLAITDGAASASEPGSRCCPPDMYTLPPLRRNTMAPPDVFSAARSDGSRSKRTVAFPVPLFHKLRNRTCKIIISGQYPLSRTDRAPLSLARPGADRTGPPMNKGSAILPGHMDPVNPGISSGTYGIRP